MISDLGQIHALEKVFSRTSVMRHKGMAKSMPEIGCELGVDAILEGSVQRTVYWTARSTTVSGATGDAFT